MIADLEVINAKVLQFDSQVPGRDIKPFRPTADWAHRGEMTRVVLTILRQAFELVTARDIARNARNAGARPERPIREIFEHNKAAFHARFR